MDILKIIKMKDNKYKIILDNGNIILTYDDVIIKHNLLYKKSLNDDLINKIEKETLYYDNYNNVLKYVLKKIRCKHEIKDYLNSLDLSDDDKDKIWDKLNSLSLLNDKIYTSSYINDKFMFSKDSLSKIKKDLLDKEIDLNIIDDAINNSDFDEYKKLQKLIIKRINTNNKTSNILLKNKIISEFVNLGYCKDMIIEIYDNNKKEDYDLLLKEYKKTYNRLSKKYQDNLEYKIKAALFSKGFDYNNIKKEDLF